MADIIKNPEVDKTDHLNKVEREILNHEKPKNWNVHDQNQDNMERTLEVDFHEYAIAVFSETGQDLESATVFVFYSTVGMLEKKHKPK